MPPTPPSPCCLLAATESVRHRVTSGLIEGFSQWWQMPALVLAIAVLTSFIVWMYRRDAAELPRGVGIVLAALRLAWDAFARAVSSELYEATRRASTGDVRGTYAVQAASNGTLRLIATQSPVVAAMGVGTLANGLFGVTQYATL